MLCFADVEVRETSVAKDPAKLMIDSSGKMVCCLLVVRVDYGCAIGHDWTVLCDLFHTAMRHFCIYIYCSNLCRAFWTTLTVFDGAMLGVAGQVVAQAAS